LTQTAPDRVAALDLIRGIAVLGILAVNISGFAGPTAATLSPHVPMPGSFADQAVYAGTMVLFEGKMRALFTLLFGASMLLFVERMDAAGRDGDLLQLRRLGWLLLFGYLHFLLFWWGDILFAYALVGIVALLMRELPAKVLLAGALLIFAGWHLGGAAMTFPEVRAEEQVGLNRAEPSELQAYDVTQREVTAGAEQELDEYRAGFVEQIRAKLSNRTFQPLMTAVANIAETLPLMLIGMVLYRSGFFTGAWPRRRLRRIAAISIGSGFAFTLLALVWLWQRHFPYQAMTAAITYWLAIPHLLMAVGYAALLVLATPRLAATAIGRSLTATGRMAFSNYIGTTIVMTAIFYGWGLGLVGTVERVEQMGFVLLGWALMLGWSPLWLARFRQGPLEWLWRSLTERRPIPFLR